MDNRPIVFVIMDPLRRVWGPAGWCRPPNSIYTYETVEEAAGKLQEAMQSDGTPRAEVMEFRLDNGMLCDEEVGT